MRIKEVLSIEEPQDRSIILCERCQGLGWYWSDLEFGDAPGDEHKIDCSLCGKTGRLTMLTMKVKALVPYHYDLASAQKEVIT